MNIIGLNIFHADTSACLIVNNEIVAAAEKKDLFGLSTIRVFQKTQ